MKYKKVLSKSLKINFFRYVGFILSASFAIMINFIYSTVILNPYILKDNENIFISYIAKLSIVYIMICIAIFIVYSYNNYMKWRTGEFRTFILLGITRRELKKLLLMESFVLLTTAVILGTCFGIIFSKIFFLSIIKLYKLKNVPFEITHKNYINVLLLFLWILLLIIYKVSNISKRLNVNELLKYKNRPIPIKLRNRKLRILAAIIVGYMFYKKMSVGFSKSMEFYVTNIFISMIIVHLSFAPVIWLANKLIKKSRFKTYIQIKSIKSIFNTSGRLTFLITILSFMIISYARINYVYNIQLHMSVGSLLVVNKVNFITFIYLFTVILCFIIFSTIIFYKACLGISTVKSLYDKLFKIGITKGEFKKLIEIKLLSVFFKPLILSLFMSAVYNEISNLKFTFYFGTVLICLLYFLLLLVGYFAAKRKYEEEIFKR
ncbi:FtsX-like permease family protein [Clostridium neuense]|uniref:FtsX-like permease family protein n=1 Tax=Clostridium neuense TaxID=1728934 RepID=A0ABW8TB12_9CLOT